MLFQIEILLSIDRVKLDAACNHLKLGILDDEEYSFLQQYHKLISLVDRTLKTLESDRYSFGIYLPALFGLKSKLDELIEQSGKTFECLPLAMALRDGLQNRFGDVMDPYNENGKSVPLYIAMLTNPSYKLNFMGMKSIPTKLLIHLKEMLYSAVEIQKGNSNGDGNDSNTDRASTSVTQSMILYYYRTFHCYFMNSFCKVIDCILFSIYFVCM